MARRIKPSQITFLTKTLAKNVTQSSAMQSKIGCVRELIKQPLRLEICQLTKKNFIQPMDVLSQPKTCIGMVRPGPGLHPRLDKEIAMCLHLNEYNICDNEFNSSRSSSLLSLNRKACPKIFSRQQRLRKRLSAALATYDTQIKPISCDRHNSSKAAITPAMAATSNNDKNERTNDSTSKTTYLSKNNLQQTPSVTKNGGKNVTAATGESASGRYFSRLFNFLGNGRKSIQAQLCRSMHSNARNRQQTTTGSDKANNERDADANDKQQSYRRSKRTSSDALAQTMRNKRMIAVARDGIKQQSPAVKIPVPTYEFGESGEILTTQKETTKRRPIRRQASVTNIRRRAASVESDLLPEQPRGLVRKIRNNGIVRPSSNLSKFPDGGVGFKRVQATSAKQNVMLHDEDEHSYIESLWATRPPLPDVPAVVARSCSVHKSRQSAKDTVTNRSKSLITHRASMFQPAYYTKQTIGPIAMRQVDAPAAQTLQNRQLHEIRTAERNESNQRQQNMKRQRDLTEKMVKEQRTHQLHAPSIKSNETQRRRHAVENDTEVTMYDTTEDALAALARQEHNQREYKKREAEQRDLNRRNQERLREVMHARSKKALSVYQKEQEASRRQEERILREQYEQSMYDIPTKPNKSTFSHDDDDNEDYGDTTDYLMQTRNEQKRSFKRADSVGQLRPFKPVSAYSSDDDDMDLERREKRGLMRKKSMLDIRSQPNKVINDDQKRENAFEMRTKFPKGASTRTIQQTVVGYNGIAKPVVTPTAHYKAVGRHREASQSIADKETVVRNPTPCLDYQTKSLGADGYLPSVIGPLQSLLHRNENNNTISKMNREYHALSGNHSKETTTSGKVFSTQSSMKTGQTQTNTLGNRTANMTTARAFSHSNSLWDKKRNDEDRTSTKERKSKSKRWNDDSTAHNVAYTPGKLEAYSLDLINSYDKRMAASTFSRNLQYARNASKRQEENPDDDDYDDLAKEREELRKMKHLSPLKQQELFQKKLKERMEQQQRRMAIEFEETMQREDLTRKWYNLHLSDDKKDD